MRRLNEKYFEEIKELDYPGPVVCASGEIQTEVSHRLFKGGMMGVWVTFSSVYWDAGRRGSQMVLFGSETRVLNPREKIKVEVVRMKCLKRNLEANILNRIRKRYYINT